MTLPGGCLMNRLASTAGLLLAATGAFAQSPAPAPAAAQQAEAPPVFRSGLDLVRVDIRVTDADGRPIPDLRPEEVQIEEEGTPRPILLFQHTAAPEGSYAEAAQRTIGAQVSTNQAAPRGHVYVLVFDEMHILPGHEQRARLAAERFLRTHVRPGDRVALYALPGPGPQIEFTGDVRRVIDQLTAVRGAAEATAQGALGAVAPMRTFEAYEVTRGNQQMLDRLTLEVSQNLLAADTRTSNRQGNPTLDDANANRLVLLEDARAIVGRADGDSRRFLMALADVVRTLRAVEGRKAVILFSEGFQIDNVTHELEDVAAAAAQSYSVIYAMDLNPRTIEATEQTPRGGEQSAETRDRLQSLGTLTAATAGTLVTDAASQLDRALARIAEVTEDYYLVGFAPVKIDDNARDRYRRLRVSVSRPGAHVSARTGYALAARSVADRRRDIDGALHAPFSQTALPIEYTTYTLRGTAAGQQRVILSLESDLPLASGSNRTADVVFVVRDVETGRVAASATDQMPLPQTPRAAGATTGAGVYRVQIALPAGTYLMRAVVREPGGLIGSADRRFEVRALDGPDVTASDLVLGSSDVKGLPVRATAHVSDLLTGVLEVYGRTALQIDRLNVTADLVPLGGDSAIVSTSAELQPVTLLDNGVSRGVRIELPLTGVAPGQYLVRATIRQSGDTLAELFRDVSVGAAVPSHAATPSAETRLDPLAILGGEVGRRLVTAIESRAKGGALQDAARAAAAGRWTEVDTALGAGRAASASPDEIALGGLASFARRDYAAARARLRAAQESGLADPALAFVLGWAHAAAGDDRAAITAWRAAIVQDATLVPSYLALVDAYSRLGEPDLARQVIQSGLGAVPASPELLDRLARLRQGPQPRQ
jgi:VWFA-related protein